MAISTAALIRDSAKDRSEAIGSAEWSANFFRWDQIQSLANYMRTYRVPAKKYIFREGDEDPYMCLIADGSIDIYKKDAFHTERLVVTLDPGKAFGEISLFDGQPRSASAVSAVESTLLVLTKEDFQLLCEHDSPLAVTFLTRIALVLSQRLRDTSDALLDAH